MRGSTGAARSALLANGTSGQLTSMPVGGVGRSAVLAVLAALDVRAVLEPLAFLAALRSAARLARLARLVRLAPASDGNWQATVSSARISTGVSQARAKHWRGSLSAMIGSSSLRFARS